MRSALRRALRAGLLGLLGPCGVPSPGAAQPLARDGAAPAASMVTLVAPACEGEPYDRGRLVELLRVELTALGPVHVVEPPASDAVVEGARLATVELSPFECRPSDVDVVVVVTMPWLDAQGGGRVQRVMPLLDVVVTERPRALAIGIAELLGPIWAARRAVVSPALPAPESTLPAQGPPAPPAAPPGPTAPVAGARPLPPASTRPRDPELSVDLSALVSTFPGRSTTLLGGAAQGRWRLVSPLVLRLGGDFGVGTSEVETGTVRAHAVMASVGLSAVAGDAVELEVGPRLQSGYAWAVGSPQAAGVEGRSYGDVVAVAAIGVAGLFHTSQGLFVLLGGDAGYTLAGVEFLSDGKRVAGLGGPVLGARAGVGLEL